jgi:D-alanyl-D-alanine carboxypeptidase
MNLEVFKRRIAEIGLAIIVIAGGFFVLAGAFDIGGNIFKKEEVIPEITEQEALQKNLLSVGGKIIIPIDTTIDPDPVANNQVYPAARLVQLKNEKPISFEEARKDLLLMLELRRQQEEQLDALDLENNEPEGAYFLEGLEYLGSVNAQSFLVGDLDTGEVIFERKADEIYAIASISKYFTAYTAVETMNPNEIVRVDPDEMSDGSNRGGFSIGDKITVRDMLYPLLLVSSNEGGEILARSKNRSEFIESMNEITQSLKLEHTKFGDPTGLSRENVSTARDLFTFMQAVKTNYPQIVAISGLKNKTVGQFTWYNINKASAFPEFRGGKTGFTNAAKQTSIGYYEITLTNGMTKNIGMVILQSNTRQQDTRNVLDYLKNNVVYLEQADRQKLKESAENTNN